MLNLIQLLVVLRGIVLLRGSGREAEALFLSNAFTLYQALLVMSSLKIEFSDQFRVKSQRFRLATLSGLVFGLAGGPLAFVTLRSFGVDAAAAYAGLFFFSAVVTSTYHAFIAASRIVVATLIKGAPFLLAVPGIAGLGWPVVEALLVVLGAGMAIAIACAMRLGEEPIRRLIPLVLESAWSLRTATLVAVVNAFALNVVFIVIQASMDPAVVLDYFEHLRLFVGPLTVIVFPIGQRIYSRTLDDGGASTVAPLVRPRGLGLLALAVSAYVVVCYPGYVVVARVLGIGFLDTPSLFMYFFVLGTSVPRVLVGLWFPLILSLRVHVPYLMILVARIAVTVVVIASAGQLDLRVFLVLVATEVLGAIAVLALVLRKLRGAPDGAPTGRG